MPDRERFTITVQDAGDRNGVPIAPRLRRMLKTMLRGYGIRCVNILPESNTTGVATQPRPKGRELTPKLG